jgi:hypothetical protein
MRTPLPALLIVAATTTAATSTGATTTGAWADPVRGGQTAFGDWHTDAPGVVPKITSDVLPAPFATRSAARMPSVIAPPAGTAPQVPPGFQASLFAAGLDQPRTLRTAPNGDIFVAETGSGRIRVLRTAAGLARPVSISTFASDLNLLFDIAFWPPGPSPRFVYIGETDRISRYPYQLGDLQARGPAQVIVRRLPDGGHWTRDIVFSPDGTRMFVGVGSAGNLDLQLTGDPPADLPLGAAWGDDATPTYWNSPRTGALRTSSLPACGTVLPRRFSREPAPCGAW